MKPEQAGLANSVLASTYLAVIAKNYLFLSFWAQKLFRTSLSIIIKGLEKWPNG